MHELRPWYKAVESLRNPDDPMSFGDTIADYHLLLVFTGLRRGEAGRLRWHDVDLDERTIYLRKTKNGERVQLPLSEFAWELLVRRQQNVFSSFVFPGRNNRSGLVEPKKQTAKVIGRSGVVYTLHDLRRTFITIAESLNISPYAIKRLVNHKMSNDVTAGYIVSDTERLRRPTQQIADLLASAFDGHARSVVPFPRANVTRPHKQPKSDSPARPFNPAAP